jgi:hypothetical protein
VGSNFLVRMGNVASDQRQVAKAQREVMWHLSGVRQDEMAIHKVLYLWPVFGLVYIT